MKITEMPRVFEAAGATHTQKMAHARNHMKTLANKYGGMTIRASQSGNGFPGATGTHNGHTWTAKVSYGNASNGETFAKHEYTVDDEKIDPSDQWNVHKNFHDVLNKPATANPKSKNKVKEDHMVVTQNHEGQKLRFAVFESNGETVRRGELLCCEHWMNINEFTNTCPVCGINYKSNGEPVGSIYNRENDDDDDALSNTEKNVSVTETEKKWYVASRFDDGPLFKTGYLPGIHIKEDVSPELKAILRKKYDRNEDQNRHTENGVLLAKHFGTPEEHAEGVEHLKALEKNGHGSPEGSRFNYEMSKKYYHKLRESVKEHH